ncbi:hypothetical protein EY643_06580 [Halioglobus maricola]|uniref:Glucosamine/galactosamine-6-phosphate isomerase domain-containing protein n=1 Tax=Halioglobus maricola TaxID=2601894 RepID=A0A5P9NHN8_9GAMM|nr:6-phosphogluconolactonase [Halioglobus maricola]QFU75343.1 hypothetical protein EY643_06580 [Halioglobus maricola]
MRSFKLGKRQSTSTSLVQEDSGIHVGISPDLPAAARQAANLMYERYSDWLERDRLRAWGPYKRNHFTIAIGGGNTIKAQYHAWLELHHSKIDWLGHVRFFFLEESTGEKHWESAEQSLRLNFLQPLAEKLCRIRGLNAIRRKLDLERSADREDIVDAVVKRLCNPINLAPAHRALQAGNKRRALQLARAERERYQQEICRRVGASMSFHYLISGIGKDGTLGSFPPYSPDLAEKEPAVVLLAQENNALRVALNRGVFTNAETVSLLVAGTLKLKALGRLEMDEVTDFEQTVMETPLRLLRETWDIANKVYIFADEQALHFDETVFEYKERGQLVQNKAETRAGDEQDGVHILLMHGFLGLFSFASLLIRLPSSWTVSALHRGSRAKFLPQDEIFPHYALALRKAILRNWRRNRPTPVAGHSIAGVIMDHLLLSLLPEPGAAPLPYERLRREDRDLVDALRAGGMIHLATWSPADGPNTGQNIKSLVAHLRHQTQLDYGGFEQIYDREDQGKLHPVHAEAIATSNEDIAGLERFLQRKIARPMINSLNLAVRRLLNNSTVQHRLLNADIPYVLRLVGSRLLRTVSLYGLTKEIEAALCNPAEYQQRHLQALEILLAYDIPWISIVHQDDFLVSARRHREEFEYLVEKRLAIEGVNKVDDLKATLRYVLIERSEQDLPIDMLNPHLLVMATNNEGNRMVRQITSAMTRFVNENLAKAADEGRITRLASVDRWLKKQKRAQHRRRHKVG